MIHVRAVAGKSISIAMENKLSVEKTLKFRDYWVKEILDGKKTVTWRLFDDKNLSVGDHILLRNWNTKNDFAEAEIVSVKEKKLKEIEDIDYEGHEKFKNKNEMFQTYRKYYGDKATEGTIVKVISFKLTKILS